MPEQTIPFPLSREAVAAGKSVAVLPCRNPALAPELSVVGLPGTGWHVQIRDGAGTVIWSALLQGE